MPARRWCLLGLVVVPVVIGSNDCRLQGPAQPKGVASVIVRIGNRSYSQDDLDRFFGSRLNEFKNSAASDEAKSALLDSFVEEKLLLEKADQLKIEADPRMLASMREKLAQSIDGTRGESGRDKDDTQNLTDSLKIQEYLHDYLFKELSVTREESEAYYKDHLDEFVRNDVVHVREILVDTLDQAMKIQNMLKAKRNKNFAELARLYSKAPTAAEGGDLGTFQRGELPEELEKVIFPLPAGTVSKPVSTQYGYHTFLVEEKILAHQQRFYEVESQIHEKLIQQRQRAALDKELASLWAQTSIQLDPNKLNFKYMGTRLAAREGNLK